MDAPSHEKNEIVQEITCQSQAHAPGSTAAKFSIIAAVTVIGLNFASITIVQEHSVLRFMVAFVALGAMWAGVLAALTSLIKVWKHPDTNTILLSAVGLLLNVALLAIFFKPPALGRANAAPDKFSAKSHDVQPISSHGGRIITTTDWTAGYVVELTDSTFDNATSDSIVLVDCWSPRCGPCRRMSPIIDELAGDYKGRVKVCKLNVDLCRNTAAKLRIRAIPTILLYRNGRIYKKWVGLTDKSAIMLEINKPL